MSKSIGVFDSGFGGITILKQIKKTLPEYNYIYLGDTARNPYGSRSQNLIYQFSQEAADFLFSKNCELIIFACNTASAQALRKIQQEYLPKHHPKKKVLGVIIPAVEIATTETKNNKIGIIGTEWTILSQVFKTELKKLNPKIKVFSRACPLLVPIIESGEAKSKLADLTLKKYLKPLIKAGIDTLILGCTHYGILENKIKKILPKKIKILSEGRIVAEKLDDYLKRHPEIKNKLGKNKKINFYTTDLTKNFEKLGTQFWEEEIKVKKIEL